MTINLDDFNERSQKLGGEPQFRAIVISVHGINTTGPWQKDIAPILQRKSFFVVGADYGFNKMRLLTPKRLLNRAVESVWDVYRRHYRDGLPFCAIGHSFGTLALSELLEVHQDARFDRLILAGSIIRRDFPWNAHISAGKLTKVLNEASQNDRIVSLCRFLKLISPTLGVGCSGTKGFVNQTEHILERSHKSGHSGVLNEVACEKTWAPFLLGQDKYIQLKSKR